MADGNVCMRQPPTRSGMVTEEPPCWVVVASVFEGGVQRRSERIEGIAAVGDWEAATLIAWTRPRLFSLLGRRGWSADEIAAAQLSVARE